MIGFTSDFVYFPDDEISVILLSNTSNHGKSLIPVTMWLSAITLELPYSNWQIQPKGLFVSDKTLRKYVGTYLVQLNSKNVRINITLEDGQLFSVADSKQSIPKSPIFPLSGTKFFLKDFNIISEFITDKNGNVIKVITHEIGKDVELTKIR